MVFMGLGWCWAATPIGPEGRGEGKSVLGKGVAEWLEGVATGRKSGRCSLETGQAGHKRRRVFRDLRENPQVILVAALPR